jgi:hypothetical protein
VSRRRTFRLTALLPWRGWSLFAGDLKAVYAADYAGVAGARLALPLFLAMALLFWWFYVPIHELLHVLGCVLAGGTVSEVRIGRWVGGTLWASVLPFVRAEGALGGRVVGFDPGSDLGYLLTDLLPYLLTPLGLLWVRRCVARRDIRFLGAAGILGFAPMLNLLGDFYEMGAVILSGLALHLGPAWDWRAFRADDLLALADRLPLLAAGAEISLPRAWLIVAAGLLVGAALAGSVYGAAELVVQHVQRKAPAPDTPSPEGPRP